MRITDVRLNSAGKGAIAMGVSALADDESLWTIESAIRDTCCVTLSVLAAESLGVTIVLEAVPEPAKRIWIASSESGGATVFGAPARTYIEPAAWQNGRAESRIDVDTAGFRALGVAWRRAAWDWQWGYDGDSVGTSLGTSEHLVFAIAGRPTFPWLATGGSPVGVKPWAGALALACEWASGATRVDEVPDRMAAAVAGLGSSSAPWRYNSGSFFFLEPYLGTPFHFHCELFIKGVRGDGVRIEHLLSCYEAGAAVITFANLLGASLRPVLLRKDDCKDFLLNNVWPIGQAVQTGSDFWVHVVACDISAGPPASVRVYDPMIRIDSGLTPEAPPNTWTYASGMILGTTASPKGADCYLPQLIDAGQLASCTSQVLPLPHIAKPASRGKYNPCDLQRRVRFLLDLTASVGSIVNRGKAPLSIKNYAAADSTPMPPPPPPALPLLPPPPRTRVLYAPIAANDPDLAGRRVAADVWSGDAMLALYFMAELLTAAERTPIRVDHPNAIAYVSPDGETLWMLLDDAVARLTSTGPRPANMRFMLPAVTPAPG
jgi:hypothetical protein